MITKSTGRYNLCSTDDMWLVAIRLPPHAPQRRVSEMWPLDDEPDIDDMPPSEVIEVIAERRESHLISTSREEARITIDWVREHAAELDAAWAESEIALGGKPIMKQSDIDRALILFYASSNHAMRVNYTISSERVEEFCRNPPARAELVHILRHMADRLEKTGQP